MNRFLIVCLLAGCGIVSALAASPLPQSTSMAGDGLMLRGSNPGLGSGCCLSHSEPRFICEEHEPQVREGMREGWFAARDSDR